MNPKGDDALGVRSFPGSRRWEIDVRSEGLCACFLVDGEALHHIEGKTFTQRQGSLLVRHSVDQHQIKAKGNLFLIDIDPEETALCLEFPELVEAHRDIFPPQGLWYAKTWVDSIEIEDPPFLKAALHRYLKEKLRIHPPDFSVYAQRDIVSEICRSALTQKKQILSKENIPVLVKDLLKKIDLDFSTALNMESLAREFEVSEGHLSRSFKEHTGWRVIDHLIERRLQAIKEALIWTSAPIQDIARNCGFREMPHFNRLFRKRVGVTPKVYRDRGSQKGSSTHG